MQIQPYLFFEGRCEEAFEFYRTALGATSGQVLRYRESPEPCPEGMLPPGSEDKVMHMSFRLGDSEIFASDGMCSGKTNFQGISLALSVPTVAEANQAFAALSADGQVQMPIGKTFWSPAFGMVTDKFGLAWMVMATP